MSTLNRVLALLCFLAFANSPRDCHAEDPLPRGYPFPAPPLEVWDRLTQLRVGPPVPLDDSERKFLLGVWLSHARPNEVSPDTLLDAMLFASGAIADADRAKYRKEFLAVVERAETATKQTKAPRERGEKLMRFLHEGPMRGGYDADQHLLTATLDNGKFNCVSSSVLYFLVGSRLGLELKAISIPGSTIAPGHATLDLVDGRQLVQLEPTHPDGFDWGAKLAKPNVIILGSIPDRSKGRTISPMGLAALIYSNRGVMAGNGNAPAPLTAVRLYLAALMLDPSNETAANNLVAAFTNWGPSLADAGKFEDGTQVLALGASVAPSSRGIANNRGVVWTKYIQSTLAANKDADAVSLIRRASAAMPADEEFRDESRWFARLGESLIQSAGWDAGLAVVPRARKVMSNDAIGKIHAWRSSVYRRWSQSLLACGDIDASLRVLARAAAESPDDGEIAAGVAFHTQEALRIAAGKGGIAAVVGHHAALRKSFPGSNAVIQAGDAHAGRAVQKLADDGKFEEALAAVATHEPIVSGPAHSDELLGMAYDRWARDLAAKKEWKKAIAMYQRGMKALPKSAALANNAVAVVDVWARPAIDAKRWDDAIAAYEYGLGVLPGDRRLEHNLAYCKQMQAGK